MPDYHDIDQVCRGVLNRQIERATSGDYRVKVPAPRGVMRRGEKRHFHFTPEIFIQVSGRNDFDFPHERFRLLTDDICVMPAGMPHRETAHPWRNQFRQIVFMFTADTMAWHLKEGVTPKHSIRVVHPTRVIKTPEAQRVIRYLMDLCEVFHSNFATNKAAVHGLLMTCLALIRKILDQPDPADASESHKITLCRHEILRRLADPELSVRMLARFLRCSPSYLSHLFHQESGATLIAFIHRERIAQAKSLLETSALYIKEIAYAVGTPDAAYFSRIFRRSTGQTPHQYRAGARNMLI